MRCGSLELNDHVNMRLYTVAKRAYVIYNMSNVMSMVRCVLMTKTSRLLCCILVLFALAHFALNYFVSTPSDNSLAVPQILGSNNNHYRLRDIKHIEELQRIKRSVSSELRELERKRTVLQEEIITYQSQSTAAESEVKKAQSDLESLRRQILQTKNEKMEVMLQKPKMAAPVRLLPGESDNVDINPPKHYERCKMHSCFDYSRCPLTSEFPVYVYPTVATIEKSNVTYHRKMSAILRGSVGRIISKYGVCRAHSPPLCSSMTDTSPRAKIPGAATVWPITSYITEVSLNAFLGNTYVTSDAATACLYIVFLGEVEEDSLHEEKSPEILSKWLSSLSHWRGDGRNHLVVHLSRSSTNQNLLPGVDTGRAMVAQSAFLSTQFRNGFDVVLPSLTSTSDKIHIPQKLDEDDESELNLNKENELNVIMQVPVMRKYFLSFSGQWSLQSDKETLISQEKEKNLNEGVVDEAFHKALLENLEKMAEDKANGKMLFETNCLKERMVTPGFKSEWALCGTTESRLLVFSQSTFSLIIVPENYNLISSPVVATRLAESLHSGAVPVVLGNQVVLPFSEHIDWTKAAIILPKSRITELAFLLSSFPSADVCSLRRQGKFIYDTYFSSARAVLDSTLATVRTRINIPPKPIIEESSNIIQHEKFPFEKEIAPGDAQSEFAMPPPEGKIDSVRFVRNFTFVTLESKDQWNKVPGPFHLFPSAPNDRNLPSDAKFLGSSTGFRPIAEGQGGTGELFQRSLGGNVPREQFTIVMLTYEREEVLLQSIQRLKGLPFLNKVIIIWNAPDPPADNLQWPDVEVEVAIIHPKRNSLNNRFIPYDAIDTDAVLSIDDDAHLRHDEILFAFRIWREARDRIVGFPGRFHTWDMAESKWEYYSHYSCELSMVLTGAAFVHKYYMFLYTNWMPQTIRDKVDEFMNCEDIAMNFLVSHLTRMPPIKVTSRWTFRCPGCPEALSTSDSHFNERHICINYFVKVFGYMPLLNTQFRVDSILFKTRLPHDKQKCFKFI